MPMFMVERSFAEQMDLEAAQARALMAVNADVGVSWLFSFLSADRKKTYCLYEAPSAELIREAARRSGIPVDAVIEVSEQRPEQFSSARAA
jgi:cell division inhibitor SulA